MATDDQNAWIRRVLGVEATSSFDLAGLRERLMSASTDMELYNATDQLSDGVRQAAAALKSQRPDAEALINALEARVAQVASAFRRAEAEQATGKGAVGTTGVVAFAKMRLRWENARTSFADAVTNVIDGLRALLETDEFQDDPRSREPDTLGLIDALAARLPQIDDIAGAIDDALDSAGNSPEKRAELITAAAKAIDSYRSKLAEFDELKDYESTEAGKFPSISLIEASLADLKSALTESMLGKDSKTERERTAA